jgi:DNA-binding transcriptional ArsR family regulator
MAEPPDPRLAYESLAGVLGALASPARLELLHVLRTPRPLHDIRLAPSRARAGDRPGRPITRQAVARHLEALQEASLVRRMPGPGGREGDRYALNHERVFAVVDELRSLAKLRPFFREPWTEAATLEHAAAGEHRLPEGPRLLVAYGRDDGTAFSLAGAPEAGWRIGRAPRCEIRLDYDPYLSASHATLHRERQELVLRDGGSRNGTWVNWARVPEGEARRLAPGDLVVAGRSILVFQP